ncbi:hypothetical protein [Aliikangiella marina]|nr:hypothetical protein [Aliikangiella marina]
MPAYMCKCGTGVSVGEVPCDKQWNFISNVQFDKYEESIDSEELY